MNASEVTEDTGRDTTSETARDKRIPSVPAPKRRLSPDAERTLTQRQLEILDALEQWVLRGGSADVTMAEIARQMGCSLRTLYAIAPSKDELVLIILDLRLHRFGREAVRALELEASPLARLRAYLRATNLALQPTAEAFLRDFARVRGVSALNASHADYIVAITGALLEEAVAAREIAPVNTRAIAFVLGRLGADFARARQADVVRGSPQRTADEAAEIILNGLRRADG